MAPQRDSKRTATKTKGKTNHHRRHHHHSGKASGPDEHNLDPDAVAAGVQRRSAKARSQPSRSSKRAMNANNLRPSVDSADRPRGQARQGASSTEGSEDASNSSSLTRTGRISRALKGKPVHQCDVCDKVYTRNEHLRRHQLNHSAQALKCDVPGCDKTFHRTDLLSRHREEHSAIAYARDPSVKDNEVLQRLSPGSAYQEPPIAPVDPSLNPGVYEPSALPQQPGLGISQGFPMPVRSPFLPENEPGRGGAVVPYYFDSPSMTSSPRLFESPVPEQAHFANTFHYSPQNSFPTAGTLGVEECLPMDPRGSKSPVSASSSIPRPWQPPQGYHRLRSAFSPSGSDISGLSSFDTPALRATSLGAFDEVQAGVPHLPMSVPDQDSFEQTMITRALATLPDIPRDTEGVVYFPSFEGRYLEAYWGNFHPMFSIMHRPSFDSFSTSPLVKSLMVAIGAQYFDDDEAQGVGRCLREACMKLLQRRPSMEYRMSRLWDLQAVFLSEAFSLYCSRRPSRHFSQRFEDLLAGLITDPDNSYTTNPLEVLSTQAFEEDVNKPYIQWIHIESKRRLLLASYIIEIQQAGLFGSQRPVSDKNLPLPCSNALWEAHPSELWLPLAQREPIERVSLADALTFPAYRSNTASDPFASNTAIAYFAHSMRVSQEAPPPADLAQSIEQTPRCLFSYHAALLAAHAPVSELLAVSGESFILGEKLPTRDLFQQAIHDLRRWTADGSAAPALQHALQVLKIAMQNGRCGLIHEDWALTLAVLVCWACAIWPAQGEVQAALSREGQETSHAVSGSSWAGGNTTIDWRGARACLAWVKDRIEGRMGWLNQDAGGILRKLYNGRLVDVGT